MPNLIARRRVLTGKRFDPNTMSTPPGVWFSTRDASKVLEAALDPAENNDTVLQWDALSGSRFAQQATETNKPIFKTNIRNGYGVIESDGVDDLMFVDTGINSLTANISGIAIFMVLNWLSFAAAAESSVVTIANNGAANQRARYYAGLNSSGSATRGLLSTNADGATGGFVNSASNYQTGWAVETLLINFATGQGRIKRNGADILAWSAIPNMTPGNTPNTNSGYTRLFAVSTTNRQSNIQLGDVAICYIGPSSSFLNDTEILGMERHLSGLWGGIF